MTGRYSASGLSSYSTYRSPYLESQTSSYSSSSYALPSYESKFESLISRIDGRSRSRAGTSTKYDYLSTYSTKFDYPSSSSSSSYSKYDGSGGTYGGTSGYTGSTVSSPYGGTSAYGSKYSSNLDADDLTRSYFEKYYNKSTASEILDKAAEKCYPRASRALSVYLDESSSPLVSTESKRTLRSTSVLGEGSEGGGRYSRLSRLNSSEEGENTSIGTSRRFSLVQTKPSFLDSENDEVKDKPTSSYTRYLDREKEVDKPSVEARETTTYSRTPGYSRFLNREKEEDKPSPTYSRYSSYTEDAAPSYRRDYTRTYGGRSDISEIGNSPHKPYSSQNGRDKESGEVDCSKGAGSGATGGTGGLKNLGNTCFMNSVIQCLSNTKLLADYLLSDEYTQDLNTTNSSMKGSLVKAFATMIKSLWKPGARIVDPSSLKGAVQRFAPRFSGYNQEDSQEFLRYLLEGLHEDLNRVATKPQPINSEIDSNLSVHEQGMEAWKRYLRRDDSKLVDIFGGQLKSTLRCSSCDFESVTFEPFWDLSLPIPSRSGEVSLNECLEAFTKEEVMEGDEMPTCGRCKTRRRCTKYYSLYKLPRVLVVHLKRFSPTERFRSKLSTTVTFPLTALDVSRFSDSPGRATYSCYAVSNHSGTLYSGHYTAYARNPKTCEWNYFNDSRVSKSSSSNVISNEAYLLFFELLT